MITPAYAPTATERVLPRLALDFTTGVLDPRVTVTRALNTATRVNSSGLIETVNADLPRFDYDPVTLAPKGLLIEESRVNTLTYSDQFQNAAWDNYGLSVSADAIVSPSGTLSADKLTESAAAGIHLTERNSAFTQNSVFSVYAKAGERTIIAIGDTTNLVYAKFDLSNGTVVSSGAGQISNGTISPAGNGWYRVSCLYTHAGANRSAGISLCNAAGNTSYTGDGTSGLYVWGAQIEAGAFATSYIPTTTTSLTRNADVVAMTGTNFSSWWQATTGAMTVRARQLSATSTRPWTYISDGTANNIISLRGNVTDPELYIKATTDQVQIDAGTLAANTSYGFSGAWNTNDCAAAFNGGSAGTDASATIPTVDRMLIGSDGTNYLSGWAEKISYWPQRITNAETQAFSK